MWCGRIWWAAPAALRVTGWRSILRAAWSSPAPPPPISPPPSVADGNNDSFVASYDSSGNQTWIQQIQTLATNQANSVSVDASGNIYIGGAVSGGVIGAGQTAQGGGDAYLAKFDANGNLLAENQFGTSGADQVSATATGSDGSLYVASVQNGDAVVAKYASGDITSAPVWTQDLGALSIGGAIGGLTVSGSQVYVSGTTSNANLTAGGQASIAAASTGGTDAFVFNLTDNGSTATANHVSYVGTAASDQGGAMTVGPDGTVYLAGTTTGTFAGQQRSVQNVTNAFAAALNANGSVALDPAIWRRFRPVHRRRPWRWTPTAPVCWMRWACRAAPSISTSRWTSAARPRCAPATVSRSRSTAWLPRTTTITIDPGETLDSLTTKINAQLGSVGKAAVNYTGSAEGLKITVNAGQTIRPDFRSRAISMPCRGWASPPACSARRPPAAPAPPAPPPAHHMSGTKALPTYGLGLTGGIAGASMDISTKTGADLARSQLLSVLSNIQNTYQKSNTPPAAATVGNTARHRLVRHHGAARQLQYGAVAAGKCQQRSVCEYRHHCRRRHRFQRRQRRRQRLQRQYRIPFQIAHRPPYAGGSWQ